MITRIETIDLVEVIDKEFPLIDNNLSMRRKNVERRKLRAKKQEFLDMFTNAYIDIVREDLSNE